MMRLLRKNLRRSGLMVLLGTTTALAQSQGTAPAPAPAVNTLAQENQRLAAEDWNRMLKVLGMTKPVLPLPAQDPNRPSSLTQKAGNAKYWYDAAGNGYIQSLWGTWQNYDEAKANPFPLPDPLLMKNGQRVTDAVTWWKVRQPEILRDFQTEMYGEIPANTPKVTWEATPADPKAAGTDIARITNIVGHIDNSAWPAATPRIEMTLYLPLKTTGPVPVMVLAVGGSTPAVGTSAQGASANTVKPPAVLPLLLAQGWGCATVSTSAIQADNGAGLTSGIIGLMNKGEPRKPDQWGALAAWSWGLSRAIDYLETNKAVDAKRLGIEGHSRWGKTALLAAALEPRWAIVYASCSGEGGAKPSRRDWGETLDNVCGTGEYHWMAGNCLKYAGHWGDLPVDSPELIALVAPRPVFIGCGTTDQWADPHGQFLAAVAAGPVYRLLGRKDVGATELPAPDAELIAGDIGFRMHQGGHTDALDWPTFLKFADKYFGRN
jgi:hypothetical protein